MRRTSPPSPPRSGEGRSSGVITRSPRFFARAEPRHNSRIDRPSPLRGGEGVRFFARAIALALAAVALLFWNTSSQAAEPDDVQDVLFLGGSRVIKVRLHIFIDGRPYAAVYREAWDDYLKAL